MQVLGLGLELGGGAPFGGQALEGGVAELVERPALLVRVAVGGGLLEKVPGARVGQPAASGLRAGFRLGSGPGPAQLVNDPCTPHAGWRVPSRSSRGSPDGVTPMAAQPFATVVIKNYPGDEGSRLDRPDTFRVNISPGKEAFIRWTGHPPRESAATEVDPGATDTVTTHPVYGSVGWLAVVSPGPAH